MNYLTTIRIYFLENLTVFLDDIFLKMRNAEIIPDAKRLFLQDFQVLPNLPKAVLRGQKKNCAQYVHKIKCEHIVHKLY